ncbi:glycosyltransferase involved in cell wall biosynthesis [Rhodococcus sp. 27YEA15]|uniref:glycosyltransferase family 2 protein n=1 Tax=Rhodococcus sp. 27YEA15 TaxID=3156259 RepID=UPI003C7C98A3
MSAAAPLVTVLVPAYNAAPYLRVAMESVLAQDFRDFELLIVDDGSTDDTHAVLSRVTDPRVRVVRQENTGLVGALNNGLALARGEFVARMDADDLMAPGRLSAQLAMMVADDRLVSCGTDYVLFGDATGRVRMPRTDRACRQRLLLASCHCGASVMVRRSVLDRSGLQFRPEFAHAEDYRFFSELSEHGTMSNVPMVGYHYRIYGSQVSSVHRTAQRDAHLRIAREHALRTGAGPLSDHLLERMLWPVSPPTSSASAIAAHVAATARPAVAAVLRRPGFETVRFSGRKIVEALAAVRASR